MTVLRGITWNHTRGYLPMVATAQRFSELHPEVVVQWEKRSLQEFADQPVEQLSRRYDLLVVDHPFTGFAARHEIFFPLNDYIDDEFLLDQSRNSVGKSYDTYTFFDRQWALAIDAATPISTSRQDLLRKHGFETPKTWNDLLDLARKGLLAIPAIPVDSMMNFYMLCVALGEEPAQNPDVLASRETAATALEILRELLSHCSTECLCRNPIQTMEVMTQTDTIAHCPFAYGYSNYSRPDFARTTLKAGGLVTLQNGMRLRSTLGGTGLAVSRHCSDASTAFEYAQFVASQEVQKGIFFQAGGQPGHRSAWLDNGINAGCNDFFIDTLHTLDEAYVRPRFEGAIPLQDKGGPIIHTYLRGEASLSVTIGALDSVYRSILAKNK